MIFPFITADRPSWTGAATELAEAGPPESAGAYREKKVREKIVKALRAVCRVCFDLDGKLERLQGQYNRVSGQCYSYSARLDEVSAVNKSLKEEVRDYERLKRAIGPEQTDRKLEDLRQREQAEKERKRAARPNGAGQTDEQYPQ